MHLEHDDIYVMILSWWVDFGLIYTSLYTHGYATVVVLYALHIRSLSILCLFLFVSQSCLDLPKIKRNRIPCLLCVGEYIITSLNLDARPHDV